MLSLGLFKYKQSRKWMKERRVNLLPGRMMGCSEVLSSTKWLQGRHFSTHIATEKLYTHYPLANMGPGTRNRRTVTHLRKNAAVMCTLGKIASGAMKLDISERFCDSSCIHNRIHPILKHFFDLLHFFCCFYLGDHRKRKPIGARMVCAVTPVFLQLTSFLQCARSSMVCSHLSWKRLQDLPRSWNCRRLAALQRHRHRRYLMRTPCSKSRSTEVENIIVWWLVLFLGIKRFCLMSCPPLIFWTQGHRLCERTSLHQKRALLKWLSTLENTWIMQTTHALFFKIPRIQLVLSNCDKGKDDQTIHATQNMSSAPFLCVIFCISLSQKHLSLNEAWVICSNMQTWKIRIWRRGQSTAATYRGWDALDEHGRQCFLQLCCDVLESTRGAIAMYFQSIYTSLLNVKKTTRNYCFLCRLAFSTV